MRRFRWVLVGVLSLSGVGLIGYRIMRNDPFAFLRPFDPIEQRYEVIMLSTVELDASGKGHPAGTGAWCVELKFPKTTQELLAALTPYSPHGPGVEEMDIKLPDGRWGDFNRNTSVLLLWDEPAPSWLDVKVDALRRALHLRPNLVAAKDQ